MSRSTKPQRLEDLLQRLEVIVTSLESEELDLERSIAVFEEGTTIARECHKRLDEAERKVEILRRRPGGKVVTEPFEEAD